MAMRGRMRMIETFSVVGSQFSVEKLSWGES
jgi:hypothetical protein